MPSERTKNIISGIVLCYSLVTALTLIYCLYVFNKIKKLIIYTKRYPKIVQIECYFAIFICVFIWPLWVFDASDFHQMHNPFMQYVYFVNLLLYPFIGHAITTAEATRLWCMYYKLKFMNDVSNNEWKSVIDNASMAHNWYIMFDTTYGRIEWVAKRAVFYWLFGATTSTVLIATFGYRPWTLFIDCCVYCAPILFMFYLYCQLERNKTLIHDNFLFYYEFVTTNMVLVVSVSLYALLTISFIFGDYYVNVCVAMLGTFALPGPSVISALYIPQKILNNTIWTGHGSTTDRVKQHAKLSLDQIFENKIYTEYFIQHMVKEFSLEAVLSWIEMKQFKYFLYQRLQSIQSKTTDSIGTVEPLPSHIPLSTIIYHNHKQIVGINDKTETMELFKKKYIAIYNKYISIKSPYQINISYELRNDCQSFKSLYECESWNANEIELLNVFDDVIKEMRQFMWASSRRFFQTEDFSKIYKEN